MTSLNRIVRNALAAYNASGTPSMRWWDMYVNNDGLKWGLLAAGKPVKARQAFERYKKAVEAMGARAKSDTAQEVRDFEAMLREVERWWSQSPYGRSLIQWRESKFPEKIEGVRRKFGGEMPSSVMDYYKSARDTASKPNVVKARTRDFDDDEYLE